MIPDLMRLLVATAAKPFVREPTYQQIEGGTSDSGEPITPRPVTLAQQIAYPSISSTLNRTVMPYASEQRYRRPWGTAGGVGINEKTGERIAILPGTKGGFSIDENGKPIYSSDTPAHVQQWYGGAGQGQGGIGLTTDQYGSGLNFGPVQVGGPLTEGLPSRKAVFGGQEPDLEPGDSGKETTEVKNSDGSVTKTIREIKRAAIDASKKVDEGIGAGVGQAINNQGLGTSNLTRAIGQSMLPDFPGKKTVYSAMELAKLVFDSIDEDVPTLLIDAAEQDDYVGGIARSILNGGDLSKDRIMAALLEPATQNVATTRDYIDDSKRVAGSGKQSGLLSDLQLGLSGLNRIIDQHMNPRDLTQAVRDQNQQKQFRPRSYPDNAYMQQWKKDEARRALAATAGEPASGIPYAKSDLSAPTLGLPGDLPAYAKEGAAKQNVVQPKEEATEKDVDNLLKVAKTLPPNVAAEAILAFTAENTNLVVNLPEGKQQAIADVLVITLEEWQSLIKDLKEAGKLEPESGATGSWERKSSGGATGSWDQKPEDVAPKPKGATGSWMNKAGALMDMINPIQAVQDIYREGSAPSPTMLQQQQSRDAFWKRATGKDPWER